MGVMAPPLASTRICPAEAIAPSGPPSSMLPLLPEMEMDRKDIREGGRMSIVRTRPPEAGVGTLPDPASIIQQDIAEPLDLLPGLGELEWRLIRRISMLRIISSTS